MFDVPVVIYTVKGNPKKFSDWITKKTGGRYDKFLFKSSGFEIFIASRDDYTVIILNTTPNEEVMKPLNVILITSYNTNDTNIVRSLVSNHISEDIVIGTIQQIDNTIIEKIKSMINMFFEIIDTDVLIEESNKKVLSTEGVQEFSEFTIYNNNVSDYILKKVIFDGDYEKDNNRMFL